MAANTAENGQCEALVGSEGTPNLVTVREASPPPPAEEAAPRPLLKRFEDLPEMVEMLSPLGTEDDGNKTDVENLSDHENMDTAEEKTALSHREEDSGDENKTDVEDLDMGSARHHGVLHEDPSASDAQDTKVTAKRFIEEVQVDSVEHKRVSKQNKFHRSDANHLGQRPSHSRQRSHSQPGSLSSPGAVEACQSPRSASSETEFANLSAHVRAVLGEIEVRSLQFKAASEARKSRGRCATSGMPYRLAGRADQERLLRKFFVEEDVGNLTDEGEFVIMPEPKSPTGRLTAGIEELDVSSGGTDVEELDAEPHRAVNSGREWTETDPDSGEVRHIISKTTHTTVTSVRPTEGAPRGDTMSSSVSRSSKDDHRGSAASAPSDHDEAESLTFFQKKEFFEKLSEQSPPQEALSASRLGSTPSLDTALTRPAVSVKPRPRSESLTSQGEIVEESIVFAERLRLFQGGTQASSGPSAGFPQLDDLAEQQPHQGTEEKGQVAPDPSQPRRLEESQDLEGKGGTRLLVHTSDADKEALDVCSVQVSEDARDQQFSRMRVRVPALEESVAPTESPQPKVSPLRDAYKDSLLTAQQESGQAGKPADPSTVVDDVCLEHGAAADLTVSKAELPNQTNKDTFDRPLTRERDASSLFSSQSHLLASGLQMGIVAGPGILQQGIIASSQSGILETLSSSPTDLMASEFPLRSDVSPEQVGPTEESRGRDVGRIGALVAAAPVAVLPVSDILSGKQLEMLDIAQVPEESSLLEAGVQRPTHGELSQSCPKEKTMIKTEYADIQHKLSSAFGESLAPVESKTSIIQGMPKEVLEAFDRSTQEFVASKLDDEESEQIMHIASATTDSVPREFIPEQGEKVARGATSEPDLEEPARDAASHLTALHLASEHVEIPTEEEMVEEEKLQALMASRLGSESVTREIDEDIYRQDIEEFIAVLEDYEPLPAGHLAKLKPGSRDSEPTLDSKFLSKTEREKDKKAKESSGCVEVCFVDDSTAYDPNSSSQLMGSEGSGLLTEEHSLAKHHDPATLEPSVSGHKDDLTSVPSKTKFKEKEEEHLDESFLISHDREGTSSFSCVGVEVKDQQCVERSLEVTRVSECEESPADDDLVDRAHESTKIDRSPLSTDGSAKDLEALQKGSDSNVQELLDLGNKISDVPLSYGSDDREKESSPEKAVAVAAEVAASLAEYSSHHVVSAGCLEAGADVPCSSDEDQQKELSKYKEVELAIPFLHAGSSSLEEEVEDGGSFSSGDLQAEKIAEFLTADSDLSSEMIHFPQVFQDNLASSLASSTAPSGEKRVGFVLDGATAVLEPDRQGEIEEASRIVDSVVHMASSLVESLHPVGPDVASSEGLCDSGLVHAVGSPPEGSEISETFSQAGPMSAVEKDRQEGLFGVKEMYQVLKESRSTEDRVQYSVMGEPLIADEFDDDAERRRRSSPAAESMDDQAQIEKCSREVMMQLLDGFSKSDVELAEVRTEDEAPDIEDDVPSPEAGSQEEKSVPSSQDNSGDLQPQLSTEVEIGSQASGALAPLSELDYELCPDAERTSGDEVMATGVPPLEPERDAAVVESSHAPSAAADPATSAVRSAGGRERSPLLEASPPEETAYRPEQDVSPAQEYPEYLSPDMQVRVGVSPTEVQPVKEKPARYSESSMESSSEVGSPCPQSQGGTAMAFENVAFAGEDVIDATSSPVEESSSPAGSRSPYEVVRDARTEEATSVALMEAEKSLQHAVREETFARPQSLVSEERSDQPELQITTKIFAFDQSPGVCAPEKKELSEGLLGVGLLTVSDMTARTPESRRGDSDEDEEEWADHVMSKIRGRPVPPTPPASPRTVQSAVEVQGEQVTWEAPVEQQEGVQTEVACDIEAEEPAVIEQGESGDTDVTESATGTQEVRQTTTSGKRPQLEHIPSEISDEDLVEREQSPTHVTATCRGDRKDSSSDRNSSPDSDGPRASGSHCRTASGVGTSVFEASSSHESGGNGKQSHESHDKGTQEDDKIAEEPEDTMFVIEEEMPMGTNRSELSWGDTNEKTVGITGGLSPGFDSPPKTHDGSSSGKLDAASPVVLRSKSKRTEKRSEKRSSRDMDTGHSGSETDHSHYYSFEMTSDSGKTPGASRPTSSEFDLNVLSGQASSEYETCATSQDGEVSGSYATAAASSHDTSFATARSSLSGSSRGSAYSVDSESSGHLGSMEVSEASETIVASAHEELDSDNESERSKSVLREPYDGEIPESVIRGGVEHPFLPSWQSASKDPTAHGSISPRPSTSGGAYGPFQTSALMEPGHSYTGWTPVGSSAASGDPSRGAPRAEVLNGASASPEGQERRPRPGDDHMASSHEEEQLSVSESSATQSEHTWQTSVETMVDAVEAQHFSCDSERHHHRQSTMQNLASLPLDQTAVVEGAGNGHSAVNDSATPPFQEVNGPVEVDYVPEYDDLAAGGPVRQQDTPEGQAEPQVVEAVVEAAGGDAPASHELDEQENSTELREEGFYAEIFQGDLSSEEVESAANEALLLGGGYHHERTMCNVGDEISPGESFERPVTPEPVVTMDAPSGTDHHADHSAVTSVFEHAGSKKSPTLVEKDTTDSDPENEPRECAQGSKDLHTFQDHPRSESASSSPETATADDIKLYTSKCEDYILQMHQTYRYGVGLPKSSDEHFLPEEGMDVENVKLLEGRLQEGSGSQQDGSQQDFPYDLSYEQEYAGDVRVEHGDLYTHQEVEEEAYDDERTRLRARRRLSPISDERGSTPDYDTLAGRKMFGKSSEKDDASTSSLMEFERLEAEMASGTKSSSVGSSDSFSGRQQQGRNGTCSEQDSVSLNSLTEFERLEKELVEAEGVDTRLRGEVVARLDEIDEGHESQASDPGHEATVYNEDGVVLLRQAPPSDFHASEEDQEGGKTVNALSEENQSAQELEVGWSRTERHFLTTRTESGHSVDSVDRQSSASTATQFDTDSLRDREIDDSESNFCPDTPGWTQKECTDLDSLHDSLHDAEHHDSLQEVLSKENDSLQLRDPSGDPDSLQDDRNELQDSLYEAQDIELDSVRAEETSAADGTSNIWQQFPSQIRTTELSPTLSRPASSPLVVPVVVERIDTLTWVDQDSTRVFVSDGESLTRPQEHPCNDTLVSSTDSLEPTSSANTHATYQCDTDSMMSSLNSAEESTMVSSTDTLDHETLHFTTQGKTFSLEGGLLVEDDLTKEFFNPDTTDTPRQNKRISLEGRVSADDIEERFRECLLRSAVSPTDEEQVEECQTIDEKGNLIVTRTVKRHVTSEPQLHTQTFAGPDAEQQSREFVASFAAMEPSSEKDEYEGFDTAGNAVRVTQHVLVRPTVKTVTFTGPDARLQMREYMRSLAGGQHSSAENTPTSDSGVGACSSLASPQPLAPDPPAAAPTSACPGLQRLSGGDHWVEAESAMGDSSQPATATRMITTRTTRTVGPDGREQLVTTTTTSCEEGGDEPETRLRRSMQGVLDSFMAEPPPSRPDEE